MILAAVLIWSCAPSQEVSEADRNRPGRSQYTFYCGACHGKAGAGAKNLFPPLTQVSWVNLDPEIPIRIVLCGLEGRLTLGGEEYMNVMPPLGKRMDDATIAKVLTYVRASFGNAAGPVTSEDVARVRAEVGDCEAKWKVEEIEALIRERGGE